MGALRNQRFGPAAFERWARVVLLLAAAAVLAFRPATAAQDASGRPQPAKQILLFYSDNVRLPFSGQQDKVLRERLARLFPGAEIFSENLDVWEKYKWYLLAALLAILLESLFLARLAFEVRRRRKSEAMLKDLSTQLMDAQEKERRRIARELHDDVNQRLVLLVANLENLERSGWRSKRELATVSQEAREVSLEVNRLSHQLHSSALDLLGLVPALRGLAQDFSRVHGLPVRFSSDELGAISPDVELCLFRVAQEALSNVVKHSGASHAEVRLCGANGSKSVRLTVDDDGKGFDPAKIQTDSLGIISMRERLRLVGGELRIVSGRPAGTRVEVSVPVGDELTAGAAATA